MLWEMPETVWQTAPLYGIIPSLYLERRLALITLPEGNKKEEYEWLLK